MAKAKLNKRETIIAVSLLLFTVIAFSFIEIIVKPIAADLPPLLMNFWRFAIGAGILLPFMLFSKRKELLAMPRADYIRLALIGTLNIFVSMGFYALCMKHSRASTAAVLFSANPLATNFFSWLILKETMSKERVTALTYGLVGIVLLTIKADSAVDTPLGIISGLLAMLGFGFYTVMSKPMVEKHGGLMVFVISTSAAVVMYLPLLHILDLGFWPPSHTWPNLLGVGVWGTGLGFYTYMKAMEYLSAGQTSYLFFFKPPLAMFFAWLLLSEKFSSSAAAGTMLIMLGILTEIKTKNSAKNESKIQNNHEEVSEIPNSC
jgi:drug/metabolite transporter (DMT)-like permease